jgi:hypothetical protein
MLEVEQTDSGMEIAAELFLRNFTNKELLALIPVLVSKEEVKLLKLIDMYVEQNKAVPHKKDLIDFLLNPKAAVKNITETYGPNIDIGFDFAELFPHLTDMHTSGTMARAEEIMKYESAEFLPMELNDKAKELSTEFDRFRLCGDIISTCAGMYLNINIAMYRISSTSTSTSVKLQ